MNTKLSVVTLALLMAGYAQAQPPLINGAIMITGGEVNRCTFGNIDDVWVVTVTALNAKGVLRARRYISGSGNSDCMILPLLGWPGSTVTITGVIQDTLAIPGFASKTPAQISENCFNVEAFTVGLAPVASGFNPQDPATSSTRRATALPGLTAIFAAARAGLHTPWLAVELAVAQPSPPSSTPTIISRRVVRCCRRCASGSSRRPCWLGRPPRPAHLRPFAARSTRFAIFSCAIRGRKASMSSDSTIAGLFATVSSVTTRRE